jgi:hypothetical protein
MDTNFKNIVIESGLARLWKHMEEHDCGMISAFRYARDCGKGKKYSLSDNIKRNKLLLAKLFDKRYNVTSIKGSYIENYGSENAIEVSEESFFVVDSDDRGNLLKDLISLGEEFEQDSISFLPKGSNKLILYGTSKCEDAYPPYGTTKTSDVRKLGKTGQFFSRVKNRPFSYISEITEHVRPEGFVGRMGCNLFAKGKWEDIE